MNQDKNRVPYIGVDLDGTLASDDEWLGMDHIGSPVPLMLERVKGWISEGITVKIVTARAAHPAAIPRVKEWLREHGLGDLEVTCSKDMDMLELWDDRAVQVIRNTGKRADGRNL